MIYSVTANRESFHSVHFHKGLNIIVGKKKTFDADGKRSCNSLGKSTLLQIIDFCLGSDVNLKSAKPRAGVLPAASLPGWEFTLEFDLFGSVVKATRSTLAPDLVDVVGDDSAWPFKADLERENGLIHQFQVENWRMLLNAGLFGFPSASDSNEQRPFPSPSFRELFRYFCRVTFDKPLKPFDGIGKAEIDKCVSCLLGLNWDFLPAYGELDARAKTARDVKKGVEIKRKEWNTTITTLRKECRELAEKIDEKKELLDGFKVDPYYEERETEANRLSAERRMVRSRIVSNRMSLDAARAALSNESAGEDSLVRLYKDVAVAFPPDVLRTLEEVKAFQRSVTENRREFLTAEIKRLETEIKADAKRSDDLDKKRSELLKHLSECGALKEFSDLQNDLEKLVADLTTKENCVKDYETSKDELEAVADEKRELVSKAKDAFETNKPAIDNAEGAFDHGLKEIYGFGGSLGVSFNDEKKPIGFVFDPDTYGSGGKGVDKATTLAFDLALLFQQRYLNRKLDFLIHDSELFVSIEERPRALALKMAGKSLADHDCQYITCLNYDMIPPDDDDFKIADHCVLELGDASTADKLLGIDFNPKVRPVPEESKEM